MRLKTAAAFLTLFCLASRFCFADSFDPGDDTPAGARPLPTPKPSITRTAQRTLSPIDTADWFRIALVQGFIYNVSFNRQDFAPFDPPPHPHLTIRNPAGGSVANNIHIDSDGFTFRAAQSGNFLWAAIPFANPPSTFFSYILSYQVLGDPADPADDTQAGATVLALPTLFVQRVGPRILSANFDNEDWFAVDLTGGLNYEFNSGTTTGDPLGQIFDSSGNLLASNDNSGGLKFRIFFTAPSTDTFFIRVLPSPNATPINSNIQYTLNYRQRNTSGGGGGGTTTPSERATVVILTGGVVTSSSTEITGTAASPSLTVARVEFRHRYRTEPWSAWKRATGTDSWSFILKTSRIGAHSFEVRAVDSKGVIGPAVPGAVHRK